MLKKLFFKPRWQHKNPAVRARAIQADELDPELQEVLPEIARTDPDQQVRLIATRQLNDMYLLMRQATDDDSEEIREYAYRTYRAMLAGNHPHAPDIAARAEIIPRLDDADLVEHLARHASDRDIRLAAIAKSDKAGLLGDIAISDSDADVRLAAARKVTQPSSLERIAKAVRKTDKRLYREVSERLEELSGKANDHGNDHATEICLAVESLGRSDADKTAKQEQLEELVMQWSAIPHDARQAFVRRFEGARAIVERAIAGPTEAEQVESAETKALRLEMEGAIEDARPVNEETPLNTIDALIHRCESLAGKVTEELGEQAQRRLGATAERLRQLRERVLAEQPVPGPLLDLAGRAESLGRVTPQAVEKLESSWQREWRKVSHPSPNDHAVQSRFSQAIERLKQRLAEQAEKARAALDRIDSEIEDLNKALDDGDLSASAKAHGKVLTTLRAIGSDEKVDSVEFRGELASLRGRLQELRDWQHWSNNQAREKVCEEAEALVGAGLHPDAVKEKLSAMRAQWRELNNSEKLPGDDPKRLPAPALYRRFQAACDAAFKPAKGYFEKRAEVREKHFDELNELAGALEAAVEDKANRDQKELERLIRTGRRSFRELENIPPRQRGPMSKRLRETTTALDEHLEEFYQVVERRKEKIIAEVEALDPAADLDAAIAAAKAAQQQWQKAGRTRRNREQKLWKRFRAESDRIFEHLTEKRAEEKAQTAAQKESARNIIRQVQALPASDYASKDEVHSAIRKLSDQWREEGVPDRQMEKTFQAAVDAKQAELAQAQRRHHRTKRAKVRELVGVCQQLESRWFDGSAAPTSDWPQDIDGDPIPAELQRRYEQASQQDAPEDVGTIAKQNQSIAEDLLIQLEFLGGIESPPAFQSQRMDYQVKRLSERMSGSEVAADTEQELAELERRWRSLGPVTPDVLTSMNERYTGATEAIENHLQERAGSVA